MSPATKTTLNPAQLDQMAIDTIRFLSVDAVQKANSGHPGLPLGAAAMAYVLWTRFLRHNPADPQWSNRDRFVLSAGHGSMLLYSLLHLTGYDLPLDQIKLFRQWGSMTPGHPERGLTPGVETTTGPLGQGFGNGVGMAISEAHLAARFNRPGFEIVDHCTYGLVSDGDLMEGVASEAASLAGQLELGKLIYLFDNNHVTLSAGTNIATNEDYAQRFQAYGWHTQSVEDGNDVEAIGQALQAEEVKLTKQNLGWPVEPPFDIPPEALAHFREAVPRGRDAEAEWQDRFSRYATIHPDLAREFQERMHGELPAGWDADIPVFPADPKGMMTRMASGKVMNAIAPKLPSLMGGSADLDPSTFTALKGAGDFESSDRASGATCTSAFANTGWARFSTAWPCMAASFHTARRS